MPSNLEVFDNDDYNQLELTDFRTTRRNNQPNFGELKEGHGPSNDDDDLMQFFEDFLSAKEDIGSEPVKLPIKTDD